MRKSPLSIVVLAIAILAPRAFGVTDAEVDTVVQRGIAAIIGAQLQRWEVRVRIGSGPARVVDGQLVSRGDALVRIRTEDGKIHDLSTANVESMVLRRAFWPEMDGIHYGGKTALATFALLSAGVSRHEPAVKHAVRFLEENSPPGTYSRALRANVWATLLERDAGVEDRGRYRRLLVEDSRWLRDAMDADGWYDYGAKVGSRGDNSCTQFGVLGTWACANLLREVDASYWTTVENHWLNTQLGDGSWAYGRDDGSPRETMAIAGINSLYIVLDQYYAGRGAPYARFEGIRKNRKTIEAETRVLEGIRRGLAWMDLNMIVPTLAGGQWAGYRQFGMERLGVASGLKYIGGRDWYREGVEVALQREWGRDVVEDSFWLLFLVYGRAPILFNKLNVGSEECWNYYQRDLHYLCRHFNRLYENIHKWQIVTADSPLHDLLDAPLLYINGTARIEFTRMQREQLRAYCDKGGTIVGHANLSSAAFSDSFKEQFTALFGDRGWRFEGLAADHAVFRAGGQTDGATPVVPLEGMSDGLRTFIFLLPQDIAGAWHRNLDTTHPDLFEIMVNIRQYAAPAYNQLPGRLRAEGYAGDAVRPIGRVRVARLHVDDARVCPTAWQEMDPWMRHFRGLAVEATSDVVVASAADLAGYNLLHIAGRGPWQPDNALRTALRDYVAGGGLVLADAVGGDRRFAESFEQYLREEYAETFEPIDETHPIVTGRLRCGSPLRHLRPNRWSLAQLAGRATPPIRTAGVGRTVGIVFCPFDLTAAINGHLVYNALGYEPASARSIAGNVLAYAILPREGPNTQPVTQPVEELRDLLQPERFPR